MVLSVDAAEPDVVVSHERDRRVDGRDVMPFEVRDAKELRAGAGAIVEFTLMVGDRPATPPDHACKRYESVEQDPLDGATAGG